MQVILTKRVRNLGNIGDVVNVKPGFSRNYLMPFGLAIRASRQNLADFEHRREELEQAEAESLKQAEARAALAANISIEIAAQAAEEGKLYGSINVREIASALTAAGVEVEKSEVVLPEGPIRVIGEHPVNLLLHPEVETQINVTIVEEK